MKSATRCLLGATGLALLNAGSAYANDWPAFGLGVDRTRQSTERAGRAFDAGGWRFQLPTPKQDVSLDVVGTPAVADGFVVFTAMDGSVRALRAHDGRELWHFQARDGIAASPTVHRGRVYVAAFDRTLYALRLVDGAVLWTRDGVGIQYTAPTVIADESGVGLLLVTGFPDRRVLRIDAATGKTVWQTPDGQLDHSSNASVALGAGRAVVAIAGGAYHAFDARTGQLVWTYRAPGLVHMASPVIVGDRVFFAPGGPKAELHAVSLATGEPIAGFPATVARAQPATGTLLERQVIVSSPAVAAGRVLLQLRFADFVDEGTDGVTDRYDVRELLAAIDPSSAEVVYQVELAAASSPSPTIIPTLGSLPTPAAYVDAASGDELVATAATMTPYVRVLAARTGAGLWQRKLPAATKSSPVLANALLFVGVDGGTLHALATDANHAPAAPDVLAAGVRQLSVFAPRLGFGKSFDPDADLLSYEVRIDRDREVLEDWELQLASAPGMTEVRIPTTLVDGATYGFAVRARDAAGAWSPWSATATFTATTPAGVALNGRTLTSLAEALALAKPGDVVSVGAGRFALDATLRVRDGVSLFGAGAGRTVLDAAALGIGITVEGGAERPGRVARVTVAGGDVGVDVADGQHGSLDHVVVRDARLVGVRVGGAAGAQVAHATIVRNGTGLFTRGQLAVRNALVLDNEHGVVAGTEAVLDSRFNDVARNRIDWQGALRSPDDLGVPIAFVDAAHDDFRVIPGQPSTDKGDPASAFDEEPAPNGGRANLGAYGNTAEAEPSPAQPAGDPTTPEDGKSTKTSHGCAVALAPGAPSPGLLAVLAAGFVALVRRRRRP